MKWADPPDLVVAAPRHLAAAVTMASMPPDRQLAWLLAFLEEDVTRLSLEQRRRQVARLHALMPADSARRAWRRQQPGDDEHVLWVASAWEPSSPDELRALQRELDAGIKQILSGHEWHLPGPRGAWLRRARSGEPEWVWEADGRDAILLGVAELIFDCGGQVRSCLYCRRPFLAVRRQTFCTPQHAQLARDAKKKTRRASSPAPQKKERT